MWASLDGFPILQLRVGRESNNGWRLRRKTGEKIESLLETIRDSICRYMTFYRISTRIGIRGNIESDGGSLSGGLWGLWIKVASVARY